LYNVTVQRSLQQQYKSFRQRTVVPVDTRQCAILIKSIVSVKTVKVTLRCAIPVVCVTNEREEKVVEQHNYLEKDVYSNMKTTCFGL